MPTRLLLARHGQTEWHAENRYAGTSEVALTRAGLEQARALAEFVRRLEGTRRPTALYCSPQGRARTTAQPAADALGLSPRISGELREVHFGVVEGRTLDEVRAEDPELVSRFRADPVACAFPGSEPPEDAAERGAKALRTIAEADDEVVLVVAHNTLLRLTLCRMLGIPLSTYRTVFPQLGNCALTEIDIDGDRTALRRFNVPVDGRL
ncbi:probable phosphoglycerate mutase [Amycolatopsis marina]|uniref:Probable phosphoglycerate mutase n=1 Tax=Amycolatopsis marina TaxID=490629 RepID=A0A1I0Y5T2_9PSEU|nr:histidine phosphatase family protein [Amycolatopsis marina]SFB08187.1 probable phosphoglycerate mutase [Amycolatopsis marina]